jgi:hypothetical protein
VQAPAGYSVDLGNGFLMNPSTGQVYDAQSGQMFNSVDEFGQRLSQYQAPKGQQQGQGGSSGAGGAVGGSLGTGLAGYQLYNAINGGSQVAPVVSELGNQAITQGGSALAQGGSQALSQGGSQAVGSAMNGGTMLADGTIQGGTQAAGGVGSSMASASPYLAAAGWAYNQYNEAPVAYKYGESYDNAGNAAWSNYKDSWTKNKSVGDWAKKAFDFFTFQDLLNGGYAAAGSLFGSKRKVDRVARKSGRGSLQALGLMGPDSRSIYNLPDGSGFDIRAYKEQTGKDAYNIDFDDPNVDHDGVNFLNAIVSSAIGEKSMKGSKLKQGKTSSDLTGELYNASGSSGDRRQNIRAMGDKVGGRDAIYGGILEQWKAGRMDAERRDGMLAAIDKEYGIANPTNQRWDATLTGKDAERNQKEFAEAEKKRQQEAAKKPVAPAQSATPLKPIVQVNNTKNPYLKKK